MRKKTRHNGEKSERAERGWERREWLCSVRPIKRTRERKRDEREAGTPLKYGPSNWLRHIEFGSMGSRAHGLLELRHVIRRSVVRVEGTSSFGNFVTGFRREQNPSARAADPRRCITRWLPLSRRYILANVRASIRLINRVPFRSLKALTRQLIITYQKRNLHKGSANCHKIYVTTASREILETLI